MLDEQKGKVVTIAALRSADAMGLTTKCLATVLDLCEPILIIAVLPLAGLPPYQLPAFLQDQFSCTHHQKRSGQRG